MKPQIIKSFSQNGVNYRIVEVFRKEVLATTSTATGDDVEHVQYVSEKYVLEYQGFDLCGDPQWRSMPHTASDLRALDPVAPLLAELRALGWF